MKDDYFVLVYKILSHLYACLKSGEDADMEYLMCGSRDFPVDERYWSYIFEHLLDDGYIEGMAKVRRIGCKAYSFKQTDGLRISPKGIEYVQENNMMRKAARMLKTIKEITPII